MVDNSPNASTIKQERKTTMNHELELMVDMLRSVSDNLIVVDQYDIGCRDGMREAARLIVQYANKKETLLREANSAAAE